MMRQAFQQYQQAEQAVRRVASMVGRERQLDNKRIDFESTAAALKKWIDGKAAFYKAKDIGEVRNRRAIALSWVPPA